MTAPPPSEPSAPVVLYVDPDPDARRAFERVCTGCEVVTCADAVAALGTLDARDVAVLVTELGMSGLSGEDLLRITRDVKPRTARVAIGTDVEQLARALEDGLVTRYLVAPCQPSELVEMVQAACAGWTRRRDTAPQMRSLLHDMRSILMAVMANAEHLETLAEDAPSLRVALERATLEPPEAHRDLTRLLDELLPLARDLTMATRELVELLAKLPT